MCGTKPSPTVTRERPPCFIPFYRMSSRSLNLTTQGGTPQPLGSCALCQGVTASLLTYLWLRRETCTETPRFLRIWGTGPFRVITRRYVLSVRSRRIEDKCKRVLQSGCPNILFVLFLKRPHDGHRYSADPFSALADFKAVLEKAEKQTVRELSRKTPDSLGAKLLIASTALRACRNRHLWTLMRCCEAWKPIGNCFEPTS